jgi:hypothetical protein
MTRFLPPEEPFLPRIYKLGQLIDGKLQKYISIVPERFLQLVHHKFGTPV